MSSTAIEPVVKRLSLKAPPEKAFHHFTDNLGLWWPLETHKLSKGAAVSATFEAREGGRVYETGDDGVEREWGRVKICEPPHRLVFSWVLDKPDEATEVEVTFEGDGAGGTALTLTHRGWENRNREARDMYDRGWTGVLEAFGRKL
ncbi:MAG: SRPBCC family protein [Pseudomonadota bacterium]|nr:SRPBCC family protein [Pseudomonadota bacterium]